MKTPIGRLPGEGEDFREEKREKVRTRSRDSGLCRRTGGSAFNDPLWGGRTWGGGGFGIPTFAETYRETRKEFIIPSGRDRRSLREETLGEKEEGLSKRSRNSRLEGKGNWGKDITGAKSRRGREKRLKVPLLGGTIQQSQINRKGK